MLPCSQEAGVYRVKRYPNKSQPRASRLGRKVLHKLNHDCEVRGQWSRNPSGRVFEVTLGARLGNSGLAVRDMRQRAAPSISFRRTCRLIRWITVEIVGIITCSADSTDSMIEIGE